MSNQDRLRRLSSHLEEALQEAECLNGGVLHTLLEMATEEVCQQLRQTVTQGEPVIESTIRMTDEGHPVASTLSRGSHARSFRRA